MRSDVKLFALAQENNRIVCLTQSRRRLDERVEHRLKIKGRMADDLEHVARSGLLLQGLS